MGHFIYIYILYYKKDKRKEKTREREKKSKAPTMVGNNSKNKTSIKGGVALATARWRTSVV